MYESIVVGTDGSETAQRAVAEAIRFASGSSCELHVVSAFEPLHGARVPGSRAGTLLPDAKVQAVVEDAAAQARIAGVEVRTHAVTGDPADALLEVAGREEAELIVVGSRGMHGVARLLGSVPNKVSHQARCNVLIVQTDL